MGRHLLCPNYSHVSHKGVSEGGNPSENVSTDSPQHEYSVAARRELPTLRLHFRSQFLQRRDAIPSNKINQVLSYFWEYTNTCQGYTSKCILTQIMPILLYMRQEQIFIKELYTSNLITLCVGIFKIFI